MATTWKDLMEFSSGRTSVYTPPASASVTGNGGTPPPVSSGASKLMAQAAAVREQTSGQHTATGVMDAALTTAQNAVKQSVSKRKSGSGSSAPAPTPVNPYQAQMDAAQARLSAATPTYTDTYADRIAQLEAAAPQDYASRYQTQIDNALNAIQNRKAFQYNMSEDPLYRQYAAMYQKQGQQAMKDTMGQAAALTGGYGSSYASTAGNQAYQQYLGQMNDRAAELAALARQQYDQEGSDMRSNLSALQAAESQDRQNYESDRADYYNRLSALRQGQSTEYQQYLNALDEYWRQKNDAWNQYTYWNDKWAKMQ